MSPYSSKGEATVAYAIHTGNSRPEMRGDERVDWAAAKCAAHIVTSPK